MTTSGDHSVQWLNRVRSALHSQGMQAAGLLALEGIAAGAVHPALFNLAGAARHGQGRFDEAAHLLERARKLAPDDPNVLNSLGICLKSAGRAEAALEAYDAALKADPRLAPAHYNRGALLEMTGDLAGARAAYEEAMRLNANYVEPLASLAWLDAQAGAAGSARLLAERALALAPASDLARMALAAANLQSGDLPEASRRLAALAQDRTLAPANHAIVLGMGGDLLDAENRPAEAFAAYAAGKALEKSLNEARFESPGQETALGQARRLSAWFAGARAEQWEGAPRTKPDGEKKPEQHVFMVGFPRSGTTLLENVLAAHPDVVSLEEKSCLEQAAAPYLGSDLALERLAELGAEEADRQRRTYWDAVLGFGIEPAGRAFIDKFPLSSVLLPVVAKLFPDAKVLFAIRDPRDVVLSCFRRRFGMNPAMYQLLTLEGAAAFYDAVMRLSAQYRALLPLPEHIVRHERLVDDFDGTARAVCAFLALDWHADITDFAAKARQRPINTPSAAQVARGLNRDGQGVWRRYAEQMAPVLPLLEPWVREFGYELK